MIKSIILKTLLILGSLIIVIFLGFGYLFSQNDKTLINQIQNYNLNSALKALDERESDKLKLNQNEMEDTVEKISVHSSEFLLNFDQEGLKRILEFQLQKEGAKAIQIWDSEIGEIFLFAVKEKNQVSFVKLLPENLHQYKTIKQNIITLNNNKTEVLGIATFYYDESFIIKEIMQLKRDTEKEISNFNATIDKELNQSNKIKFFLSFVALIAILIVMSILLMSFVNKPLKKLHYGLDSFFLFLQGKQDFTKRIEINSNDEFGQMATSLNDNISVSTKLHEELNSLYNDLEEKVDLRTKELASINKEVQDSIEYAATIQKSFLKNPSLIKNNFSESFVIWEPRDKVGGDLYIYEESNEGIIFGVIDCTGHSVPGGFMTMLAGSMIKKLSNEYFNNPAKLLSELNIAIKTQLNQDTENSLSDDGLDMGLCFINKENNMLRFAGAKLDLVYFKDNVEHIIKSNKQSIGYKRSRSDYEYTNHDIHVNSLESFYLYSDGITDQTGGEKNFPFGNKKFIKFLSNIQDQNMKEQQNSIITNLKNYQNTNTRRDDITIIGFKIKKGMKND
mgnify:CR=1 FL=1